MRLLACWSLVMAWSQSLLRWGASGVLGPPNRIAGVKLLQYPNYPQLCTVPASCAARDVLLIWRDWACMCGGGGGTCEGRFCSRLPRCLWMCMCFAFRGFAFVMSDFHLHRVVATRSCILSLCTRPLVSRIRTPHFLHYLLHYLSFCMSA